MIKTNLYSHQLASVLQFHMQRAKTADWSDCGIGKSLLALAKFDALYDAGVARSLLVVCPLSVMSAWEEEISKHTSFKCTKLKGPPIHKCKLLEGDAHIFLITYDSIAGRKDETTFEGLWQKFRDDNMIVCDEATMIKSIEAKRTKALISLCDDIKFSMFLSGTFIPQDLQDIFTIYRAMDGGDTFGENIYRARAYYMENINLRYPQWVLKEDTKKEFLSKLYLNAIRLKKENCLDLPEKIYEKRYCPLTSEQGKVYNEIRISLFTDLDEEHISVSNVLAKLVKLQQIVGGFIYDDKKMAHDFPSNKYDLLGEILHQVEDDKVVIYARYKRELQRIAQYLDTIDIQYVTFKGDISESQRKENLEHFRKDPNIKVFLAQISTGGYGLTLTEANHIIYFSMTFSLIDYLQSQDRIHRIGQTKTCVYHYLLTEDEQKIVIDKFIFDSVMKNVDVAKALADLEELKKLKEIL